MKPTFLIGVFALAMFASIQATDGISVSINNGPTVHTYYGRIDGELWRCTIENDQVTDCEKVFAGPATRPVLSTDGKHIGFLKGNKVCVMPTEGGAVKELATAHAHSYLDFPSDVWLYYTTDGGFHEGSGKVNRVNIETGASEQAFNISGHLAQFGVANDLKHASVRPGDSNSPHPGTCMAYEIGSGFKTTVSAPYSCATGISSDGQYVMDGNAGHTGFDIRRWDNAQAVKSFENAVSTKWPPLNGGVPTNHAIFHSCGATNSPDWICIVVGGSRNDVNQKQILVNWKDQKAICPTNKFGGKLVDSGDFWVGDATSILSRRERVPRGKLAFSTNASGLLLTLESGTTGTIHIMDMSGRAVRTLPLTGSNIVWDQADHCGRLVPSGMYVARFVSRTGESAVSKMVLSR